MATSFRISRPLPTGQGLRVAIVVAEFHTELSTELLKGAEQALRDCHVTKEDIQIFRVAGSFELPLVLQAVANRELFDAAVALGVVIRGETPHFDYVAGEATRGIMDVMLKTGLPIGLGVLTTDNEKQARARAGGERGNKGYDAALAALEVAHVFKDIMTLK